MSQKPQPKTFVVEMTKHGEFPLDMLCYDDCEAASPEDAALIQRLNFDLDTPDDKTDLPKRVLITLTTSSRFAPTCARWASFGAKVVECSDPTFIGKSSLLTSPGIRVLDASDLRRKALKDIANAVVRLRPLAPMAPVVYDACFRCAEAGNHDDIWRREPTGFAMGVKAVIDTKQTAGDIGGRDNKRFSAALELVIDLMSAETERQVKELVAGKRLKETLAALTTALEEYA